jgi:hypothetical protein
VTWLTKPTVYTAAADTAAAAAAGVLLLYNDARPKHPGRLAHHWPCIARWLPPPNDPPVAAELICPRSRHVRPTAIYRTYKNIVEDFVFRADRLTSIILLPVPRLAPPPPPPLMLPRRYRCHYRSPPCFDADNKNSRCVAGSVVVDTGLCGDPVRSSLTMQKATCWRAIIRRLYVVRKCRRSAYMTA